MLSDNLSSPSDLVQAARLALSITGRDGAALRGPALDALRVVLSHPAATTADKLAAARLVLVSEGMVSSGQDAARAGSAKPLSEMSGEELRALAASGE